MDWRMGDGSTEYQHGPLEESMLRARREAAPLLERAGGLPGVHVETKRWSATVRYRNCERAALPQLRRVLRDLASNARLEIFKGPAVAEVRFMPGTGKAYGLRRLCRLRHWNPSKLKLIYAGDDTSDVTGMHWTLSRGGIVFDVGGRTGVSEARVVTDAPALAAAIRELARREF